MQNQAICLSCKGQGNVICYCEVSPAIYCNSCFSKHAQQRPDLLHLPNHIDAAIVSKRISEIEMCFCGNSSQKSCMFCKYSIENKRRKINEIENVSANDLQSTKQKIYDEMKKNLEQLNALKEHLNTARQNLLKAIDDVFNLTMEKVNAIESTINQVNYGLESVTEPDFIDETIYAH